MASIKNTTITTDIPGSVSEVLHLPDLMLTPHYPHTTKTFNQPVQAKANEKNKVCLSGTDIHAICNKIQNKMAIRQ
jgi:hypothetical protein